MQPIMNRIIFTLCLAATIGSTAIAQRMMTVEELFSTIEQGNKSLQSERAAIDVAARAVETAKSERLPDLTASASVSYNGNIFITDRDFTNVQGFSSPHLGNSLTVQAQQTVYAGGAVDGGIQLAEVKRRQAEEGLSLTRDRQRLLALGMYLDLFKADNSIRVYRNNIELTERLIDDIKAKLAQGMALRNDVTRYELQMETLRLGLRKMQDQRAVLNYQLCNALGIEQEVIVPDSTSFLSATSQAAELSYWQTLAQQSSPTLRRADLGIEAARAELKIARSDYLPKVALFAADNFNGPYVYDIPPIDNNVNVWYVGVGVSYSLSSLFKSNKNVRRAKAALQLSQDQRSVVNEQIDNDMQQAYTLYLQSYVDLRTQQKSVELAAQNYEVVNSRYLEQLALVTDMIDASDTKLDAELKEVDARVNIVFALYKLKYIAGDI